MTLVSDAMRDFSAFLIVLFQQGHVHCGLDATFVKYLRAAENEQSFFNAPVQVRASS